jgi:hypothetical protein
MNLTGFTSRQMNARFLAQSHHRIQSVIPANPATPGIFRKKNSGMAGVINLRFNFCRGDFCYCDCEIRTPNFAHFARSAGRQINHRRASVYYCQNIGRTKFNTNFTAFAPLWLDFDDWICFFVFHQLHTNF